MLDDAPTGGCHLALEYFNTDDGIWLTCNSEAGVPDTRHHGDVENLGFWPSPEDVMAAAERHRAAVAANSG